MGFLSRQRFSSTATFLLLGSILCTVSHAAQSLKTEPVSGSPFQQRLASADFQEIAPGQRSDSLEHLFAMARSFRYVPDGKEDLWQSPFETDRRRSGDCEDKALWLYQKMKQNGFENVRLVIGRYRPMDDLLHVWVVYEDGSGNSFLLDPALQRRVWRESDFGSNFYRAFYAFNGIGQYRFLR